MRCGIRLQEMGCPSDEQVGPLGSTPAWIMHQVDEALRFHLSL